MKRSNGYRSAYSDAHHRASPILSALLMVSITVLFVAVLGAFSLGFIDGTGESPQASFSTQLDLAEDRIIISHIGGETLSSERTSITVVHEHDDRTLVFSSTPTSDSFEVGESIVILPAEGAIDGWALEPGDTTFELEQGVTYTIRIVDTSSETVIYRTSLTTG